MATITERVTAGGAFMDVNDPGWWRADTERAIDLATLNIAHGDACLLGQRCPLETLTAYLGGFPPEEEGDEECRYQAYAGVLSGRPRRDAEGLREWASALGFNRPFGGTGAEYEELTAEWKRVIGTRREAATAAGEGNGNG
jgi:hypothetical protein